MPQLMRDRHKRSELRRCCMTCAFSLAHQYSRSLVSVLYFDIPQVSLPEIVLSLEARPYALGNGSLGTNRSHGLQLLKQRGRKPRTGLGQRRLHSTVSQSTSRVPQWACQYRIVASPLPNYLVACARGNRQAVGRTAPGQTHLAGAGIGLRQSRVVRRPRKQDSDTDYAERQIKPRITWKVRGISLPQHEYRDSTAMNILSA
jgi:hypothetical protein